MRYIHIAINLNDSYQQNVGIRNVDKVKKTWYFDFKMTYFVLLTVKKQTKHQFTF